MRVLLPNPPWDAEVLAKSFGFAVPQSFESFLWSLGEGCKTAEEVDDRLWETAGWMLTGSDGRYQDTPPELFPIASSGGNGEHFGYLIHAPELFNPNDDYPIVGCFPMSDGHIKLMGMTTSDAFANQMSYAFFDDDEEGWLKVQVMPWWPALKRRLSLMRIAPTRERWRRRQNYRYISNPEIVKPFIPSGWRHVLSSDAIGVLAPEALFDPSFPLSVDDTSLDVSNVPAVHREASRLAEAGYAASALWVARECYHSQWHTGTEEIFRICTLMQAIYEQLDRPALAAVVGKRTELLKRTV